MDPRLRQLWSALADVSEKTTRRYIEHGPEAVRDASRRRLEGAAPQAGVSLPLAAQRGHAAPPVAGPTRGTPSQDRDGGHHGPRSAEEREGSR